MLLLFLQDVTNAKFEQGDSHGKSKNDHGEIGDFLFVKCGNPGQI